MLCYVRGDPLALFRGSWVIVTLDRILKPVWHPLLRWVAFRSFFAAILDVVDKHGRDAQGDDDQDRLLEVGLDPGDLSKNIAKKCHAADPADAAADRGPGGEASAQERGALAS